jgi:hypothetical protein
VPKMRGIKPEIWTDEKFVELSPHARLLFVGMWHYACDNGHLDDKPKQIKMRVLPTDSVDARELIEEMVDMGMVDRDKGGLTIPKLRDHQRIDNRYFTWCDRCALDEIPEPSRSKHPDSQRGHGVDTPGARGDSKGSRMKEGRKVNEGDGEASSAGAPRAARKHRRPTDFRPSEKHQALAAELGVDLRREWPKFCDHHDASGATFIDWGKALNTWIRKAAEFGNVRPIQRPTTTAGEPILPFATDDRR